METEGESPAAASRALRSPTATQRPICCKAGFRALE